MRYSHHEDGTDRLSRNVVLRNYHSTVLETPETPADLFGTAARDGSHSDVTIIRRYLIIRRYTDISLSGDTQITGSSLFIWLFRLSYLFHTLLVLLCIWLCVWYASV
jgi:hypothetical protein